MPRLARAFAVAALPIALLVAPASAAPLQQASCHVWAYYMGFWQGPGSWDHQGDVLTDLPRRGKYSASDPGTVAAQIDEARSAGIEAFIVDWWGPDDGGTTGALNNVLDRAGERAFQAAASIDSFDGRHNGNHDAVAASVRHLVNGTIHHPAYLRYQGKPVIFFAFQNNAGLGRAGWERLRSETDPGRSTIWLIEGTGPTCDLCGPADGRYAFNMAWSDGNVRMYTRDRNTVMDSGGWLYVPTVHPGWDEDLVALRDNRARPTRPARRRNDGQFLRALWAAAGATGSDIRLVVSWNEFIENSHVEPSNRYGSEALDVLRELTAGGCAASGPAADPQPRGRCSIGSPDAGTLTYEADVQQRIQFNPGASLQQRIFRDGFVPNSGEFDVLTGGITWRGQRAEDLGSGRVRVYFTPVGDWANIHVAERGGSADSVGVDMLAEGERSQLIQFNPGASLQKRMFAHGFVPNSGEFRLATGGQEYAAQRAEHLGSGEVRVYIAPVCDYGIVGHVVRTGGRTAGPPPTTIPSPSEAVYRIEGWDRRSGTWRDGDVVLPPEDVCARVRWYTSNIAEVYLEHVGYDAPPGRGQVGEGAEDGCLQASDRLPQRWILNVKLRDGRWVADALTVRSE